MTRILVTGGRGLLGREVVSELANHVKSDSIAYTTYRTPAVTDTPGVPLALDLREAEAVRDACERWRPDVVVHTAAPRGAGTLPEIELTTRRVANAAAEIGARLVHLSSDMVFDGRSAPYSESDTPAPISPYGEAKLAAENAVVAAGGEHLIVRTSVIYGFDPIDHQTAWVVGALDRGEPITLFVDEFRSPVWVRDLARAVSELALGDLTGVLHVAGATRHSRWDFGQLILAHLGLDPGDTVRPGTLAESGLNRPPDLTLDLSASGKSLSAPPRGVAEVLAELAAVSVSG